MADRFYSVVVGEHNVHQVTEGSSTSSEAIELRVAVGGPTKMETLLGLEAIKNYIITRETSPIA